MTNAATTPQNRLDALQESLRVDIADVRGRLEAVARGQEVADATAHVHAETLRATKSAFGLSDFECHLLLLCAAIELDTEVAAMCERLNGQAGHRSASFALANRAFADSHWSALLPTGPLRFWSLVDLDTRRDTPMAHARIAIAERALHHLTGLVYLDESLHPWVTPCVQPDELWPGHATAATQLATRLTERPDGAFALSGGDSHSHRDIAARACAIAGMRLFSIRGDDVPVEPAARERLARTWMREALLSPSVLLVEGASTPAAGGLVNRIHTAVVLSEHSHNDHRTENARSVVRIHVPTPTGRDRRAWWQSALGDAGPELNGTVDALAAQFVLSPRQITEVVTGTEPVNPEALWETARLAARPSLGDLAQRIEPHAGWDDLVLPPAQRGLLQQMVVHVRQRVLVHEEWGFATSGRGLGITALFAGASGTGKTMASEVLARELGLDLYRIDLSQVVNKYIGETEKNLNRVFDAAESGGAILLFDEADALFGKRSEVKDSHDRYANIEISYLLQRMEAYSGLAILTTNLRSNLDAAFVRRLRFIVDFPFPDAASRAEIWRRAFPASTPTRGLDPAKLARVTLSGGNIRNIALHAAFHAAGAGRAVEPGDVLLAARTECAKVERTLSDAEVRDWV